MSLRFLLLTCLFFGEVAHADLYRWVDPETGSVKFSSYPPPWYGDEAMQRRAPKVERIPSGRTGESLLAGMRSTFGARRCSASSPYQGGG